MQRDDQQASRRDFRIRVITVVAIVVLAAGALWLAFRLRNLLFMVFVSLFVAVAFAPPVQWLERRGWKRGAATGVVFLAAFLVLVGFGAALAPLFVSQIQSIVEGIPGYVESIARALATIGIDVDFDPDDVGGEIIEAIEGLGGSILGGVIGLTATIAGFLVFATTVILFSFFMVAELPKMQRTVLSTMPESRQRRAMRIWDVAVDNMGAYIYSRLVLAAISATVSALAMYMLGVPFALSLGIWVGVISQFIPVIGTYLAMILPALVAVTFSGLGTMIWVILIFVLYQQVENYFFGPMITKRTMEIHPAVSVAAILAGGALMGGIGVILALPMAGIIQALISESRRSYDTILDVDQGPAPSDGVSESVVPGTG
jgi:predicted PurR-regulated permease PerM